MPARINAVSSSHHVQRSDSFRSERSDASAANKRVSFQPRVDVKHFAGQQQQQLQQQHGGGGGGAAVAGLVDEPVRPVYNVYKEPTSLTEVELAREAERIIQQVDQISCTVSPSAPAGRLLSSSGGPGVYETRSLERASHRNKRNNNLQQQQQPTLVQHHPSSWTKSLPSTTKNQLQQGKGNTPVIKKAKNVEKPINVINNNLHHHHQPQQQQQQQQQQQTQTQVPLQPIETVSSYIPTRKETITPPKYDSGIEMENGSLSRPNVNLIVQQLTEEARQRELIRRQYQEELMRLANESGEVDPNDLSVQDPLAPRLPSLNLIEPDPQFGLAHNRNLPFSYTGGGSPTRLSPLRSSGMRFPSPPRRYSGPTQPDDVVYAQVKMDRQRSYSPERVTDKVSGKLNFQRQQSAEVLRHHFGAGGDDNEGGRQLDSIDRAKARFLFGDDGRNNNHEKNHNNGLSYKYSSLLKEGHNLTQQQQQQHHEDSVDSSARFKTKIVIGDDRPTSQRIFQYRSDDYDEDDYRPKYRDRSVSPEPRIQPVSSRIRTIEMRSGHQQFAEEQTMTTNRTSQAMPASTRLIQEAERGRTSVRRPVPVTSNRNNQSNEFITSSRLVQNQQQHHLMASRHPIHPENGQPPKAPIRVKKLSRERTLGGPGDLKSGVGRVAFGKTRTVPWRPDASPESSPERFITSSSGRPSGQGTYRYKRGSVSPSPERVIIHHHQEEAPALENNKQDKIRRQRSKFLSVFLGSNKNSSTQSTTKPIRVVQHQKGQAPAPPVSRWTDDELDYIRRQEARSSSSRPAVNTNYRVVTQREAQRTSSAHHHHHQHQQREQQQSSYVGNRRRDSSITDRTDTSESDEMHRAGQLRFKNQRVKSQSFSNLSGSYRPDPAVVLTEERRPAPTTAVTHTTDARPYASTNVIKNHHHRIRPEEEEVILPRPAVLSSGGGRPVRYFGDTDLESQQSSGYQRTGGGGRYVPRAKVVRSASSAAGMGAVRRGLVQRNGTSGNEKLLLNGTSKQPAVMSSSLNSSESDGSAMAPAAGSADSSQRSVYLHATTVADIPTVIGPANPKLQAARKKAQSREDMSALSGSSSGSALRKTRQISRSYSVLAPWKPRHYRDKFEISYSNQQQPPNNALNNNNNIINNPEATGKPPRAPRMQRRDDVILEDEDVPVFMNRPAQPLQQHHRQSPPVTTTVVQPSAKVSRSSTMPKGGGASRVAGWFRGKKKQPR